jgi:DNA-directed RNA polymerase II subunit RPB9
MSAVNAAHGGGANVNQENHQLQQPPPAAGGLFGDDDDDDDDELNNANGQQQQQQYGDDNLGLDDDDILGLDDGAAIAVDDDTIDQEQSLLMRFCPHDSSMLYPKENRSEKRLLYACRLCRYTEYSAGSLIYKNVLKKEVENVLHTVPSAVSDDPTLPRSQNAHCGKCGYNEAVFFQNDTSDAKNDTLVLIFVCCNCDYKWVA